MTILEKCNQLLKWLTLAVIVGVLGGILGSVFHKSVEFVTELRHENAWIMLLLPVGALIITLLYKAFEKYGNIDTKRVFTSVKDDKDVPLIMLPLIFAGTAITHFVGGSAGREGAALQLGGSLGYNLGKALKIDSKKLKFLTLAGMSAVFSALFGTPLASTVFVIEVTKKDKPLYKGLIISFISSLVASATARFMGVYPISFEILGDITVNFESIWKVLVLSLGISAVTIIFTLALHKTEYFAKKSIKNAYLRAVLGSLIILGLVYLIKTTEYNGAGMEVIEKAISGDVKYEAFLLKIIFTAITIASGFKGGEIVPTFFIGATFGASFGSVLSMNKSLGGAIGFSALFAGMTKCPIASLLLAFEVFGPNGMGLFALAILLTTFASGENGLYTEVKEEK